MPMEEVCSELNWAESEAVVVVVVVAATKCCLGATVAATTALINYPRAYSLQQFVRCLC